MEQLFGKNIVREKSSDYILETILLLLIILLVSIGFLSSVENTSETISEKLIPANNYKSINSTNLTILSDQVEPIIQQECDLSLIYLFSITEDNYMMVRHGNSMLPDKKYTISNPKVAYSAKSLLSEQTVTKNPNRTSSNTDIRLKNTSSQLIYHALIEEFKNDLPGWSANIDYPNLTINFNNTIFNSGGAVLDQQYKSILTEFCPRYITILNKYAHNIEMISIEGHSSSEWQTSSSSDDAYINNMLLSQQRSNAVLEYCLRLPTIKPYKNWLYNILITTGLSSSDAITDNEIEDIQRSRRVKFKIYMQD